ncbi:MAG: hypothetical protein JNM99_20350 [Verrucomicrobiaceae bacterium]|nr:hypothetical protein [Verrucomicrobiaceae bacterium]
MLFNLAVISLTFLAFVVEEFLPMVGVAHNARLFISPIFFFCAAVAVPFPVMLLLAFITGFIWDARYLVAVDLDSGAEKLAQLSSFGSAMGYNAGLTGISNLGFGSSIILFGVLGCLMQGIRPLFRKGRWELPVFMVGFVTVIWLLVQYVILTFLRGDMFFPNEVWVKTVSVTLMAMLASPLIYLVLHTLARATNYEIRYEGLRYRFDGS